MYIYMYIYILKTLLLLLGWIWKWPRSRNPNNCGWWRFTTRRMDSWASFQKNGIHKRSREGIPVGWIPLFSCAGCVYYLFWFSWPFPFYPPPPPSMYSERSSFVCQKPVVATCTLTDSKLLCFLCGLAFHIYKKPSHLKTALLLQR